MLNIFMHYLSRLSRSELSKESWQYAKLLWWKKCENNVNPSLGWPLSVNFDVVKFLFSRLRKYEKFCFINNSYVYTVSFLLLQYAEI